MLTDLRVKLRNRRSRIASCGYEDFLPQTKQFFTFLNGNSILKAVIAEVLARYPETFEAMKTADPNTRMYGDSAGDAAVIGYLKWREFASQSRPDGFHSFDLGSGNFDQASSVYKDWYVEPLFDYLDEALDDANVILATLTRYKQKVEWYRRSDVLKLYEDDTSTGEANLKQHMFEFLFDQGLSFHVEPASASGEPDVVSLQDTQQHFIGEAKIFDPERSRGAAYIKKAFSQTYRYCLDYNEPLGYLIVFNVSKRQLRADLPSVPDGIPRFELNHKTIFFIVINLYDAGTASTLGVAETVTIQASELVREVEESLPAKS
jgi:hypothetical protein